MKLLLATLAILLTMSCQAQFNLDLETYSNQMISPWYKTFYSKQPYRVEIDSTEKIQGKYALRIAYEPGGASLSDGQVVNRIPIDVPGTKIRVTGYAKTSAPGDTAILSFSLFNILTNKQLLNKGFVVMNTEWKKFSHEFDIDSFPIPAYEVQIAAHTKQKGKFWVDNFTIEVNGTDITTTPSLDGRGKEEVTKLTTQQIDNLEALGWIWGFLKYYHPVVAKGLIEWDMELFKKVPVVKKAKDKEALSKILLGWIDSLGQVEECRKCSDWWDKNTTIVNVDVLWMRDLRFNEKLRAKLEYLLRNRHQGEGHYVKYEPVRNLSFPNENPYNWRSKLYPSEAFRLHFLFRYWNTIQYFFPYKNIIGREWRTVLREFIPKFSEAKDTLAYHIAMVELVNSVNDSHSGSYDVVLYERLGKRALPAVQRVVGDTLVVTGYYNETLAKKGQLQRGDIITHVNGRPVKDIIEERLPLVNGSNYPTRVRNLNARNYITGGEDSLVVLDILRNGEKLTTKERRYMFSEFNHTPQRDTVKWKKLDEKTGYVNMGILEKDDVAKMFQDLQETEAIVFDIRNYPRGTFPLIAQYLYKKRTTFSAITYPDLEYPGAFKWTDGSAFAPAKISARYDGKVIVVVNELTQSQAEYTAMMMQAVPGSVTVGSQTSAADGNASLLFLPGNYFTYMTGLGVFYPDKKPTQRVGIQIDVPVKVTVKGLVEGRDEYMEKVWEVLKK